MLKKGLPKPGTEILIKMIVKWCYLGYFFTMELRGKPLHIFTFTLSTQLLVFTIATLNKLKQVYLFLKQVEIKISLNCTYLVEPMLNPYTLPLERPSCPSDSDILLGSCHLYLYNWTALSFSSILSHSVDTSRQLPVAQTFWSNICSGFGIPTFGFCQLIKRAL